MKQSHKTKVQFKDLKIGDLFDASFDVCHTKRYIKTKSFEAFCITDNTTQHFNEIKPKTGTINVYCWMDYFFRNVSDMNLVCLNYKYNEY